jgi:hypothetical protein
MFTANLLSQLGKRKKQPTVRGAGIPSRKFIAGKVQSLKQEQERDRANYCRSAAHSFNAALCESAAEINDLWSRGAISSEVAQLIRRIFGIACSTSDESLKPTRVGAPRTLRNAKNLLKEMVEFRDAVDAAITYDLRHALELAWCLHEFCCDIAHYEQQIRHAYAIVPLTPGRRPKLANRPTKLQEKAEFAKIVNEYQATHGAGAFPKPRQIRIALSRVNQSVPDRTLRAWKQQMLSGTFSHHIQPKKRQ